MKNSEREPDGAAVEAELIPFAEDLPEHFAPSLVGHLPAMRSVRVWREMERNCLAFLLSRGLPCGGFQEQRLATWRARQRRRAES